MLGNWEGTVNATSDEETARRSEPWRFVVSEGEFSLLSGCSWIAWKLTVKTQPSSRQLDLQLI